MTMMISDWIGDKLRLETIGALEVMFVVTDYRHLVSQARLISGMEENL